MDERERMEELKSRAGVDDGRILWITTRSQETDRAERRPQPLPARADEACDPIHRHNAAGIHRCPQCPLFAKNSEHELFCVAQDPTADLSQNYPVGQRRRVNGHRRSPTLLVTSSASRSDPAQGACGLATRVDFREPESGCLRVFPLMLESRAKSRSSIQDRRLCMSSGNAAPQDCRSHL